jgi:hypothetical protein
MPRLGWLSLESATSATAATRARFWPVAARRVGYYEKSFPIVCVPVLNFDGHFGNLVPDAIGNAYSPCCQLFAQGIAFRRMDTAAELLDTFARTAPLHPDDNGSRQDSVRKIPQAPNGDSAIGRQLLSFDDFSTNDATPATAPLW